MVNQDLPASDMTKREVAALVVLHALIPHPNCRDWDSREIIHNAIAYADALLEALVRTEEGVNE